jgi:hypothetical protein
MNSILCDGCGNEASVYAIVNNHHIAGIVLCEACLETGFKSLKKEDKQMKKSRIHRAIIPDWPDGHNSKYIGGIIRHPCGVSLQIDYDPKEESWQIYNTDILSDEVMSEFLESLYVKIPEMFSDEEEISFKSLLQMSDGPKIFWDKDGSKWMLSDEPTYSIGLKNDSNIPNGKIKRFEYEDMIYISTEPT